MASPLERLDSIRDNLINQGLGGSGLTRQAIQRANLPQLSDELSTSRATRSSLVRQQKFTANQARANRKETGLRSSGGGGSKSNAPQARLVRSGNLFEVRVDGLQNSIKVTDPLQARKKLEELGLIDKVNLVTDPGLVGIGANRVNENLIKRAEKAGFQVTAPKTGPTPFKFGFRPNARQQAEAGTSGTTTQTTVGDNPEEPTLTPSKIKAFQAEFNRQGSGISLSGVKRILNQQGIF